MNRDQSPPPGWPTLDDIEGPYVPQAYGRSRPLWEEHTVAEPAPDAFMQGPDGKPIALYAAPQPTAQHVQAAFAPPPPPAQPDVWPKRILCSAVAAPAFGWSASMLFGALAGATTALGYLAACIALGFLTRSSAGGGGKVRVDVRVDASQHTRIRR